MQNCKFCLSSTAQVENLSHFFLTAALLCRYSVRNALGLEFLGVPGVPHFFDNTKLFVFGLIAHTLQSNGFVDLLS